MKHRPYHHEDHHPSMASLYPLCLNPEKFLRWTIPIRFFFRCIEPRMKQTPCTALFPSTTGSSWKHVCRATIFTTWMSISISQVDNHGEQRQQIRSPMVKHHFTMVGTGSTGPGGHHFLGTPASLQNSTLGHEFLPSKSADSGGPRVRDQNEGGGMN